MSDRKAEHKNDERKERKHKQVERIINYQTRLSGVFWHLIGLMNSAIEHSQNKQLNQKLCQYKYNDLNFIKSMKSCCMMHINILFCVKISTISQNGTSKQRPRLDIGGFSYVKDHATNEKIY